MGKEALKVLTSHSRLPHHAVSRHVLSNHQWQILVFQLPVFTLQCYTSSPVIFFSTFHILLNS